METQYKLEIKSYYINVADKGATKLQTPSTVFDILKDDFNPVQEEFYLLILDNQNNIIKKMMLAKGSGNMIMITPAEIFRPIFLTNGNKFIVAHNHPSGNKNASSEDIAFTKKIYDASRICGLAMLDSIVFTSDEFTSMKEQGVF